MSTTPEEQPEMLSPAPSTELPLTPATAAIIDIEAKDCIFCLSSLPYGSSAAKDEWEFVARLDPCNHYMHNNCLKPWIERANTCPICRCKFNDVEVALCVNGSATHRYTVEDKIQSVADEGTHVPQAGHGFASVHDVDSEARLQGTATLARPPISEAENRDIAMSMQILMWEDAWEYLDGDIAPWRPTAPARSRSWRMDRRRAVATAQAGPESTLAAWTIPTTRPREVFPHLEPQPMSQEEMESWRMMEMAERIEAQSERKRRREEEDGGMEALAAWGVSTTAEPATEGRKFKRPRTKRDSQLPAINNTRITTGESSRTGAALGTASAPAVQPPSEGGEATSPLASAGGLFTTLLASVGKSKDVPIVSAADVCGRDLGRMRPISPDRTSGGVLSRSRSPLNGNSPSPPNSRPSSPVGMRGRPGYNSPPGQRTPARSPERGTRRAPWELSPSSPSTSRRQSPTPQQQHRPHSPPPTESSASDSDTKAPSVTIKDKQTISGLVSAALKPHYPQTLSKEEFTNINKRVSRALYKMVAETEDASGAEKWKEAVEARVQEEISKKTQHAA